MKSIAKTEEDSPKKPIWESLLERGSCKKEEIQRKIKEKLDKDKELDPQCTFKPFLINQAQLQINKPFHERQQKWLEDRKLKINEKREGVKDKSLEKCSFQPQLGPQPQIPEVDIRNTKGMDSFIQRQEKARKLKQEKNLLLNNPYSHLSSEKKAVVTFLQQKTINKFLIIFINFQIQMQLGNFDYFTLLPVVPFYRISLSFKLYILSEKPNHIIVAITLFQKNMNLQRKQKEQNFQKLQRRHKKLKLNHKLNSNKKCNWEWL